MADLVPASPSAAEALARTFVGAAVTLRLAVGSAARAGRPVGLGPGAAGQPVAHRLQAAHQGFGPLQHAVFAGAPGAVGGAPGPFDVFGERLQVAGDHLLEPVGVLRGALDGDAPGVVDLLLQLPAADSLGGLGDGARRFGLVAAPGAAHGVQPTLQRLHPLHEFLLLPVEFRDPLLGAALPEVGDRGTDAVLLGAEPLRFLGGGGEIAPEAPPALPVEVAARAPQFVLGGEPFFQTLPGASRRAHLPGGASKPPGDLRQVRQGALPGQPFQAAGRFLGLLGDPALRGTGAGARGAQAAPLPLVLLLLPARQFGEPLHHFVHFFVGGGAALLLDGLVLVAQPVHLQLEEVGQVLGLRRRGAAASSPALPEGDLHFAEHRVRPLQVGERLLFPRERPLRLAGDEQFLGGGHLEQPLVEVAHDLPEFGALGDAPVAEPRDQRGDLFPEPPLRQTDGRDLFRGRPLVGGSVAEDAEGGQHHLPLAEREGAVEPVAAAAPAAGRAVRLPVGAVEGPDRHEEQVRGGFPAAPVGGDRVVGHQVPRRQVPLFEEERVSGLGGVVRGPAGEGDGRLRPAVHRGAEFEPGDPEVVFGADFGEDLFHRTGAGVPGRAEDADDGREVVEHLDGVVPGSGAEHPGAVGEGDPVGAARFEAQEAAQDPRGAAVRRIAGGPAAGGHSVRRRGQRNRLAAAAEADLAGLGPHAGAHEDLHLGAGDGGDVPAVAHRVGREAGVGRIAVAEGDLLRVGRVLHLDAEGRRADPVRLHEVVGGLGHAEQQVAEGAVRFVGFEEHRFPAGLPLGAGAQQGRFGAEAGRPGADPLVGPPGDRGVAGFHLHPVGVRAVEVGPGRQQERRAAGQGRRREQRGHQAEPEHRRHRAGRPSQSAGLDGGSRGQAFEAADGLLDDQAGQFRRGARVRVRPEFHPAEHRLPQVGVVLLHIERDLAVAPAGPQRAPDEPPDREQQQDPGRGPQRPHQPRRVAEGVHRRRRGEEEQQRRAEGDRGAGQQTARAPAAADAPDDAQQLRVGFLRRGLPGWRGQQGSEGHPAGSGEYREARRGEPAAGTASGLLVVRRPRPDASRPGGAGTAPQGAATTGGVRRTGPPFPSARRRGSRRR